MMSDGEARYRATILAGIVFSAFAYSGCADDGTRVGSTLSGRITFEDVVPKRSVPDEAGIFQPALDVEKESGGLRYAVVYLEGDFPKVDESEGWERLKDAPAVEVDQEYFRFIPHVIAVEARREVSLGNGDPENHNIRAVAGNPRNLFNVMTTPENRYEKRFQLEEGYAPVGLRCDIHSWMAGWIYVFDHPYFAVTDAQGRYRIEGIPPGHYTVEVVQPDGELRATGTVNIEDGKHVTRDASFARRYLFNRDVAELQTNP